MASRLSLAILVACLVAAPDLAVAQVPGGDITFKVPLNLTKLSADLVNVKVSCSVQSTVLSAYNPQLGRQVNYVQVSTDVPVSNGQVVATATVVLTNYTLTNPAGATGSYTCFLRGTDRTGLTGSFTLGNPYATFRLTPEPANITGTFTW